MQELIADLTSRFGIKEDGAKGVIGGVLKMIESKAGGTDFQALVDKVPGAAALVQQDDSSGGGGGGGLGGMLGAVASAVGGKTGSALGLASIIEKSGLKLDDAGGVVSTIVGFFKKQAGGDLVGKLVGQVPELKKLID